MTTINSSNAYRGKSIEKINQIMKIIIPETDGCTYADYPMAHSRWLNPNEITPQNNNGKGGEPCFIKTEGELPDEGAKKGYIWGPGPYTYGYYHLLTKQAHTLIFLRMTNNKVETGFNEGCCCFGSQDPRSKLPPHKSDDRDDLRVLFHARSGSTIPNDGVASSEQIQEAKGVAQAHYNADQTGAMVHAAMTATSLSISMDCR